MPVPGYRFWTRSPIDLVLAAVKSQVNHYSFDDVRDRPNFNWGDLAKASFYFQLRQRYLLQRVERNKTFPWFMRPWMADVFARDFALNFIVAAYCVAAVTDLLWNIFITPSHGDVVVNICVTLNVILSASFTVWYDNLFSAFEGPAAELARIKSFDEIFPAARAVALKMDGQAEQLIVKHLAQSAIGGPPPGLTEMVLSYDARALSDIRSQLRTIRQIDVCLTVASFLAFLVGAGIFFWLLVTTNKIVPGAIGVGGSSLFGVFCYFATGRARTSQIALGLFESLVAELSLQLNAASTLSDGDRQIESHQAWQQFRLNLYELYDRVERKTGEQSKNGRGSRRGPHNAP